MPAPGNRAAQQLPWHAVFATTYPFLGRGDQEGGWTPPGRGVLRRCWGRAASAEVKGDTEFGGLELDLRRGATLGRWPGAMPNYFNQTCKGGREDRWDSSRAL